MLQAFSIRRLLVSSFLAEIIQQIQSLRAIGVISSHAARDTGAETRAFCKSAGILCSVNLFPCFLVIFIVGYLAKPLFKNFYFSWHHNYFLSSYSFCFKIFSLILQNAPTENRTRAFSALRLLFFLLKGGWTSRNRRFLKPRQGGFASFVVRPWSVRTRFSPPVKGNAYPFLPPLQDLQCLSLCGYFRALSFYRLFLLF